MTTYWIEHAFETVYLFLAINDFRNSFLRSSSSNAIEHFSSVIVGISLISRRFCLFTFTYLNSDNSWLKRGSNKIKCISKIENYQKQTGTQKQTSTFVKGR